MDDDWKGEGGIRNVKRVRAAALSSPRKRAGGLAAKAASAQCATLGCYTPIPAPTGRGSLTRCRQCAVKMARGIDPSKGTRP